MRNRYLYITTLNHKVYTLTFRERGTCYNCRKTKRKYSLNHTDEHWLEEPIIGQFCLRCLSHFAKTGTFPIVKLT